MHALFALVDAGHVVVPAADLAARVAPDELVALRSEGVVRRLAASSAVLGAGAVEEISLTGLVNALRDLYDVDARGLPAPGSLSHHPVPIGWIGSGADEREVVVVGKRGAGLGAALARTRRTLVLLPVAQGLSDAQRARHGAGALVAVEVLAEAVFAREGRLVRAPSPSVAAIPVVDAFPTPTPKPPATRNGARVRRGAGRRGGP